MEIAENPDKATIQDPRGDVPPFLVFVFAVPVLPKLVCLLTATDVPEFLKSSCGCCTASALPSFPFVTSLAEQWESSLWWMCVRSCVSFGAISVAWHARNILGWEWPCRPGQGPCAGRVADGSSLVVQAPPGAAELRWTAKGCQIYSNHYTGVGKSALYGNCTEK